MNINITIPKLQPLISKMQQYPEISEKHVNMAISRALVRIMGEAKKEAPVGVNADLQNRWNVSMGRFQGTLASGVPYSSYVQFGTKPHFVPIDAITPWANKKGIPPWAVVKSIAKKGTKANPFMTRALSNAQDGVKEEFSAALSAIMQEIAA